jgi:hypothetical protein
MGAAFRPTRSPPAFQPASGGDSDELLGLDRQQRQGDGTDPVDLQAGYRQGNPAGRVKVPRLTNRAQQFGKFR